MSDEVEVVEEDGPSDLDGVETEELPPEDPFQVPADPSIIKAGTRRHVVFELRKAGASFQQIADKMGYRDAQTVESALNKYLHTRNYEDKETLRRMELERLDALQLIAWRLAREGNLAAIDRILKIMEMRRVYIGIEDNTQIHQQAVFIGGTHEEYVEALKKLRKQAG